MTDQLSSSSSSRYKNKNPCYFTEKLKSKFRRRNSGYTLIPISSSSIPPSLKDKGIGSSGSGGGGGMTTPSLPDREKPFNSSHSNFTYPLHQAAKNGNCAELARLLRTHGISMKRDFKGRTVLHCASNYGNPKVSLQLVTEILNCKVFGVESLAQQTATSPVQTLLDIQDKDGEVALHLAAKLGHVKVVEALLFAGADVNIKCAKEIEPIQLIYLKVPQAMLAIFDTGIQCANEDLDFGENFQVHLDFGPVIGYRNVEEEKRGPFDVQSELLSYTLQGSKCKEILKHPLVRLFLHLKWEKVRPLFWGSIALHIIWLLTCSTFLIELYLNHCPFVRVINESSSSEGENANDQIIKCACERNDSVFAAVASLLTVFVALKEVFQFLSMPIALYLQKIENLGQILIILIVALSTIPVWKYCGWWGNDGGIVIHSWQYQAAALGVFLAWSLILFQIGKTPSLGIYVEILLRVFKSFTLFVLTFTSLLVAFALSFSILMPETEAFSSWHLALFKVLVMMVGELNYEEVFNNDGGQSLPFPLTGRLLFVLFTVIITMLLFNLLIGLTVSDIQGLQTGANHSLLSGKLLQIYLMESFLNFKLMRKIFKLNLDAYKRFQISPNQERLTLPLSALPKGEQEEVKYLAMRNLKPAQSEQNDLISGGNSNTGNGESELSLQKDDLKNFLRDLLQEVLNPKLLRSAAVET